MKLKIKIPTIIRNQAKALFGDVVLPFIGFSALGIAAVFGVTFVIRLMFIIAEFAWNLI